LPGASSGCSSAAAWVFTAIREEADPLQREQPLLSELYAASVHGRIADGP